MNLFNQCKGYASPSTATAKLAKVLPEYDNYRWFIVALPNGRYMPVVQSCNTDICGLLCHHGIGEI